MRSAQTTGRSGTNEGNTTLHDALAGAYAVWRHDCKAGSTARAVPGVYGTLPFLAQARRIWSKRVNRMGGNGSSHSHDRVTSRARVFFLSRCSSPFAST